MRKMMSDPRFVLFVGWKAQFCKSSTFLNKSLRRLFDISWTKPCSFSITDHRLLINDPTTHQPIDPPTTHYLKVTPMPKLPQIPLCFRPTQPLWNLNSKYLHCYFAHSLLAVVLRNVCLLCNVVPATFHAFLA